MTTSSIKLLQRRHIEALVAIGDERSVHRAARRLGVPQPVLSRLLSDAERLLGAQLFQRSSHGSVPTAQGEAVLPQARFVLCAIERLDNVVAEASPSIRLGCIPRAMHTLMPALLARIYPTLPALAARGAAAGLAGGATQPRFEVLEASSIVLFEKIAAGHLDFAILRRTAGALDDAIAIERLYGERTVIICAADHPSLPDAPVPLAQLARQSWALPESQTTSRAAFEQFWGRHKLPPLRPVFETRSFESNLAIVAGTRLVSIAPESIARAHVRLGTLRIVQTRHAPPADPIMLAYERRAAQEPLLADFRRMLHDTAKGLALE